MSTLLPTIYSDDEEQPNRKGKKAQGFKLKPHPKNNNPTNTTSADLDDNDDDNWEDDTDMAHDFEFGGILGEDSDTIQNWNDTTNNTWTYQSALKRIAETLENDDENQHQRTQVASIIAAARRNIQKSIQGKDTITQIQQQTGNTDEDEKDEPLDDQSSSDMDSSCSTSTCTSHQDVQDPASFHSMAQDSIRERYGNSDRKSREPDDHDANSQQIHDDDDDDDDMEESRKEALRKERERKEEAHKAADYFETTENTTNQTETGVILFSQLNLSRPLLRGVAAMGFVKPTPIQIKVIPIVLAGRDVCASAVTGSGKTAAFLLPVMERILQRGGGRGNFIASAGSKRKATAATRALILTPTRELAAQCLGMMTALVQFTDISSALIVGGSKNVASQATELRNRPDVVIATPGRLLDHITNSHGVDLDDLEFLILDEADRLLDLGFQDEVHEIIKSCPTERQTLLFSATMGTKVDDLIKLSLKRPVRVRVSDKGKEDADETHVEVAHRLEQEFVRIRSGNEGIKREAILLALLTRTYTSRTIVFFDTKVDAHRMMIVCGLCGIKCTELHGNLTQIQRLEALESFREGEVTVLLCTDLAARGLDIHGVDAVINFEMPTQIESYVHRIGRTARAGKCGRSCTLIGETRRHLMKDVIKDAEQKRLLLSQANGKDSSMSSSGIIRSRTVPPSVVDHFASKIKALETHIKEVLSAEAVAKMDRIAEMEATRAKNIIENFQDIQSKPAREWHIRKDIRTDATPSTNQDRIKKNDHLSEAGTGTHRMTRKKRRMKEMREYIDKSRREEENNQEDDELNNKPPRRTKLMSDSLVKATARAQKRQLLDNIHVKEEKSIYEENVEKEKRRKSSKVAGDSLGSGGLFQEDMIAYERKSAKTPAAVAPSMYTFRGYDPNKTKSMGKKKSVHSFKSKSKFNRRK